PPGHYGCTAPRLAGWAPRSAGADAGRALGAQVLPGRRYAAAAAAVAALCAARAERCRVGRRPCRRVRPRPGRAALIRSVPGTCGSVYAARHAGSVMRVVVALGGNALLRRGQPMTMENQRDNVRLACDHLAPIAEQHELIISHGNGPQIGLLALEEA